jgi:predicted esterase
VSPSITVRRTARYETLGRFDAPIRELWFVLHGYGQLASTFIETLAGLDDGTRLIVAPEALNRFYLAGVDGTPAADRPVGATWMTREDRENEIDDYVAYLDAVAATVRNALRAQRATPRVIVLGFSQGAATAARWVARRSVRAAHLVLWGGFLPPELTWPTPNDTTPSLHIVIGSRDRFVTSERLAEEEARLHEARVAHRLVRYEGGHGIDGKALDDLARTLAAHGA